MKQFRLLIFSILLITIFTACGSTINENESTDQDTNEDVEESQESAEDLDIDADQDQMIQDMEKLNFTEFDLEVSYGDDEEYEAELKRKENGHYEVELEDEINDMKLKGKEAFDRLYPIIENLTIEKNSNQDEVIEHVLNVFGLDNEYKKFELEIQFNDGMKAEYKD